MKWIRYNAVALLCTLMFTGCVAIRGVEGTAENVRCELGTLIADLDNDIKSAIKASSLAIDQIGFDEKQSSVDAMDGVITAKTARGEKVTIRIRRVTDNSSKLKIRIGKMGDAARSIKVLEQIQKNLKE